MGSLITIALLALLITAIIMSIAERKNRYHSAGIKKLDQTIEEIAPRKEKSKMDKQNTTLIGYDQKRPVYSKDDMRHMLVLGTTGTGKTVALSNYIKSATEKGYPLLIVDGKGDTGQGSLLDITQKFCQENGKKLYCVNMNDPKKSDHYNPFRGTNETVVKDMLVNMSDWSEEHYKANASRYFQRLIKLMVKAKIDLSMMKIIEYLPVDNFVDLSAMLVKKSVITKEEHTANVAICKSSGSIAETASARFATIAESAIGEIFQEPATDIYTVLREKAVILIILNPLLYPETSQILGKLALIDSKKAVSQLFSNCDRSFFIFDEMSVYASNALLDLVNKSRSAKVTCIMATQSLADLDRISENGAFKMQIVENANNYLILRQNSYESAEECAKIIGTAEKIGMTYQMAEDEATGKGSARRVREFIVHPDTIKSQSQGEGVFLSRDTNTMSRIHVHKPF